MARKNGRDWTEYEIERAIELYLVTPFGRIYMGNPEIQKLAEKLDRSPGSISLKLANLASIDETLDRKGMSGASNLDRVVWSRYWQKLVQLGKAATDINSTNVSFELGEAPQAEYVASQSAGTIVKRLTNTRVGQDFFRRIVLASYDQRCAITGIEQPELLVAGHIRSWENDAENRMNPRNGILLNRLHDKAFEERLITIGDSGEVLYSKRLRSETRQKMMSMNDRGIFHFPQRFKPDINFLAEHRDRFHFLEGSM
jgi:putative restriction endonuclease